MSEKASVAVLISGNGSNLQALMDACQAEDFPARIALVISNKPDAYGLTRAEKAGVPHRVLKHQDYPTREAFDRAMQAELEGAGVEYVCLAGFMRMLSPWFVQQWAGKMLNIHPSLLPAFKGAHAMRDALAAGVKETGCTVHYVTEGMDEGPALLQATVPVLPGDTLETLAPRIHAQEHIIYPQALRLLVGKGKR